MSQEFDTEIVSVDRLSPHPRNYREHPEDQLDHIRESLRSEGFYRNVVVARDDTILAGHGVVQAALLEGFDEIPVYRLDVDPDDPRALKVLVGDNEMGHLAKIDDRELSEMLKEIMSEDMSGLLGTGYDEMMLAGLAFITRPASEIGDFDAAAEWVGMPDHDPGEKELSVSIRFRNAEARQEFLDALGLKRENYRLLSNETVASFWWPPSDDVDLKSVRFEESES